MATYQTKVTTELWTRNGSRTGIKPALDAILEVGNQIWLKDRTLDCRIIVPRTDNIAYPGDWIDKCVEFRALKPYTPPEPEPTIYVTHTILVYNDGSIDLDGTHYPPNPS